MYYKNKPSPYLVKFEQLFRRLQTYNRNCVSTIATANKERICTSTVSVCTQMMQQVVPRNPLPDPTLPIMSVNISISFAVKFTND